MGKAKTPTQKPKSAPAPKLDAYGHLPGHKLYGLEPQFGAWWHPTNHPPLRRHLIMFRDGLSKFPQSLGRVEHFRAATQILWGPRNARKKFVWHPWAERMLEAACAEMDKSPKNFLAVAGCASSGKCLAPDTPVLKFDGAVVPARDIRPGDLLMGDDSTPRTVLATNPGRSNMVRIVPYSGDSWECNDDHILVIKSPIGDILELSVIAYISRPYLAGSEMVRRRPDGDEWFKFRVVPLGEGDWYGWTLDGNGRFLLGDFTVTHNTDWAAVWAIINFLCLPEKTMVIVTSTTLKDSRKRIWGSIRDYWQAIPGRAPGKLVDSQGLIRYDLGGNETSDKSGITLVAAEKSKDKEALGKLIGFKADRLILIADELPELGESVVGAAYSNLANNPSFQMIGLGNPSSYYDAFGVFAKPKAGWASINAGSEEWETERGVCIRFDGEKSPNILAGKTMYPWMITKEFLEQQRESLGENSGAYWRMVRGFWSSTGASDGIYSEADIVKFKADQPAIWLTPPVKIAALDPAFTNGGDRSALYFGHYGESTDGLKTLCFDHVEFLAEDVTDKENPRTFQIVKQFRERCEAFGVLPENAAFDFSGAGKPFGDIVSREWSPKVNRIDFAGKASDLPASVSDPTPSHERYANRVTEIWFGAKELIRTQQIRGVSTSLAKEMCARTYSTVKGASMRLLAEPKPEMKMRIGKSPDEADAALMLVALCRERFGFGADVATERGISRAAVRPLREQLRRLNVANTPRMLTRV